jgi:hypothetical protein
VVLKTLKQRSRGRGRPRKDENQVTERIVPLTDKRFLDQLRQHMATFRPKRHDPLWPVTDRTVRRWLNEAVDNQVQFTWEAGDARQLLLSAGRND